jgi:hypothetical protein
MKNHKDITEMDRDEGIPYVSPRQAIEQIKATLIHAEGDCDCIANEECAVAAVALVSRVGPLVGPMAVEYAQDGAYKLNALLNGANIEIIVNPDEDAFQCENPGAIH